MDVSVIIVSWNTCNILQACLESVFKETKTSQMEVIVIDNASRDESVRMVHEKFPQVRLIENPVNAGFARANNQGMKIATGKYVLLLNSDTIVLDGAIDKLVQYGDDHKDAAIVGPRVLNKDMSLQQTCFMYPSLLNLLLSSSHLYKIFPRSAFFARERMGWWDRDDHRPVDVVTGCCMLVRAQALKKVGLMDEDYFMYAEETDWCWRLASAGWQILFTPGAQIVHLGGASSRKIKPEMSLQLKASILLFFKKHRSRSSYMCACALVSLWFLVRIPFWLGRAMFSGGEAKNNIGTAMTYARGALNCFTGGGKYTGEQIHAV